MSKVKNNWMNRMVGLALVLTLISVGLLGGTMARYITSGSGTDTARVAKWGVTIDASSANSLFDTQYVTHDTMYAGTMSVISSTPDKVVAPGTAGTLTGITISGTPEVASRISINVDTAASQLIGWTDEGGLAYEPIVWTLKNGAGTTIFSGGTFTDLMTVLGSQTIDLAPNTNLAAGNYGYEISWEWPYSGDDARDTYLGNKAIAPVVTLAFDVVVTQID